jgi:hypothetical protein
VVKKIFRRVSTILALDWGMNESDFELVEPFDTDESSLNQVNPETAFALGVEWQMFRQRLKSGHPFQTLCLSINTNRLVKLAERHRRFVEDRPTPWVGWSEIWVGDYMA